MGLISRVSSRTYRNDMKAKCKVCEKRYANYKCPRCGVDYCSVKCYKSEIHAKCSEGFYKKQVSECLGQEFTESSPHNEESARLLFENFKVEQPESDSESDNPDNLTAKEVLSTLTNSQIREFLDIEKPWWEKTANEIPILRDIPKIDTKKANNKHMGALLVNTVFTYGFLSRWYNTVQPFDIIEDDLKDDYIDNVIDIAWLLKSKTGDSYVGADDVLRLSTKRSFQLVKSI